MAVLTTNARSAAATLLLKGCRQHFRAGVTRVKKISGVIPPAQAQGFEERVLGLLELESLEAVTLLIHDFPNIHDWISWWSHRHHAPLLFESHRSMDAVTWQSIPESTNAEEAMHWKLYAAAGRDHDLLEGLRALHRMAEYFEKRLAAVKSTCQPFPEMVSC
jgi:hypothetical protein